MVNRANVRGSNGLAMAKFCKNEDCPTSEDLLAFQLGDISLSDGAEIRKHLSVCEFCAAEVEFYENYPQADDHEDSSRVDAMPEPLYELADALLRKKRDDDFFDRLMAGSEDL